MVGLARNEVAEMINTTLCYIERNGQYLMLHRTKKKNDINHDKWIGPGGKFEDRESPEDCMLREVKEETGLTLHSYQYRGLVTFICANTPTEYMHLFWSDDFSGTLLPCNEGELEWIPKDKVFQLSLWQGDRIFLRLLDRKVPFFSLKLEYDAQQRLLSAVLNGQALDITENAAK